MNKILDVPHRHCVFTIPAEYRNCFYWNREKLKDLQDMIYEVINEFANGVNYKNRESYEYFRKVWQYKLINYMIRKKPNKKVEYRILSYDGENIMFWYKRHETNQRVKETVTAQVFIGRLLIHIALKYFKMVRLYDVYAGSISVKVKKCSRLLQYIKSGLKRFEYTLKINWKKETRKMKYRELMIINFFKDPGKCLKCGYEEEVPQFVAFECYTPEKFGKKSGSPIVLYTKCYSDMIIKKRCYSLIKHHFLVDHREILFYYNRGNI